MSLASEPGNDVLCIFHQNQIPERNVKIIFVLLPTIHRNVYRWDATEVKNQEKDDGFWLLFEEYLTSLSNKILLW